MRAAIYNPYLDTLGGGERYVISVARVLNDAGWDVDLESGDKDILRKLEDRFGMSLDGVRVTQSIKRGNGYDLCFWLSDGSIPTLFARRNILHFQRPFWGVDGKSLVNRMKFFRIEKVIVNSLFTKSWIDKEYPCKSVVIYPPIDTLRFKPGKKENLILYVGRFSRLEQAKRQDILINAFKKFFDNGYDDWKLVLAGGSEVGSGDFVNELMIKSKTYPIKIIEGPSFKDLKDLYSRAKIFWSAAGYGVKETKEPNKVEHFGITVVEAMSAGAVPIVNSSGGHKELIDNGKNGFLWTETRDLIDKTKKIADDKKLLRVLSLTAREDSQKFSYSRFEEEVRLLFSKSDMSS